MSARIATEFRQHFKRDIVIDMFCYRRTATTSRTSRCSPSR